jgi:hypothetical protein
MDPVLKTVIIILACLGAIDLALSAFVGFKLWALFNRNRRTCEATMIEMLRRIDRMDARLTMLLRGERT